MQLLHCLTEVRDEGQVPLNPSELGFVLTAVYVIMPARPAATRLNFSTSLLISSSTLAAGQQWQPPWTACGATAVLLAKGWTAGTQPLACL